MRTWNGFATLVWLTVCVCVCGATSHGQMPASQGAASAPAVNLFRVDTQLFRAGERKPLLSTRSLFRRSGQYIVAYDFILTDDGEITVLDMGAQQRFILVSPARGVLTYVPLMHLATFTMKQRERAREQDRELFFPNFAETKSGDTIRFASPRMFYDVEVANPPIQGAHGLYQEFANWVAKLNSMRVRDRNMPSFGREFVNQRVADHGKVPAKVRRITVENNQRMEYWTTHEYTVGWQDEDESLLSRLNEQLSSFREVSVEDYFIPKPAAQDEVASK
ncbi:MAG: hypothetical protein KDB14_05605 [Planctomycetales bacterium]|nr:hypothetical protein [Planctomycetales bacterium]